MSNRNKQQTALSRCALVIGVGSRLGIGGAVAHRFALEGLHIYVVGRTATKLDKVVQSIREDGGSATAIINELGGENEIAKIFAQIKSENRQLEAVIYNAAFRNIPYRLLSNTSTFIEENWRVTCLAGIMVGQASVKFMASQGYGTLIYTGSTASIRGKPNFAAFASAKAALRTYALDLAKESRSYGIHVAHIIIDGYVSGDRVKTALFGLGRFALLSKGRQGTLLPDEIAKTYWRLHSQQEGAWTYELDLRPFKEKF